jgi:AraC-like DNA-binding protein
LWFFSCDVRPFNPLLDSLPRLMRVGPNVSHGSNGLLDQFIHFATAEMGNKRAGSQSILNRLSELSFVEVIRLHMGQLANNNTGWLAGLRDSLVGRALTLLHGRPTHAWTLEELASEAGASRSVLADRFTNLVGHPPIQYLTQWRMQMAADGSRRLDRICRLRGRLRIGSRIQPGVQEANWPLARPMAKRLGLRS